MTDSFIFWITIAGVLAGTWLLPFLYKQWNLRRASRDNNEPEEATYPSEYRYQEVQLASFPKQDSRFYEEKTAEFAKLGFAPLGDFECLNVSESNPDVTVVTRIFAVDHGQAFATIYHLRVGGWARWQMKLTGRKADIRVVEFETWLSDGSFVSSAIDTKVQSKSHPKIMRSRYDSPMTVHELYDEHILNLRTRLGFGEKAVRPQITSKLKSIMTARDTQFKMENEYRSNSGLVELDSLRELEPDPPEDGRIVHTGERTPVLEEEIGLPR